MEVVPIEMSSNKMTTDEGILSEIRSETASNSLDSKDTGTSTVATRASSIWSWMDEPNALNMDFQIAIDFDQLQLSSTVET
jgi:hypothetical protein